MLKPKKSIQNMNFYEVPLFKEEWNLKIDSNENLFGPSPKVLSAIKNIESDDVLYYPYYGELSEKIADYIGVKSENIKVTNGADEAIYGIFQAYLDVDDIVLTVKPTFSMPLIYSNILGGKLIEVPYKERWKFPIDDFCNQLKNNDVRIVHLTTPNNPTGETISESDMNRILELSEGKVVIIDETYGNYSDSSFKHYVKKHDNVFIVKSFSKDFALAGLRLGYVVSNKVNIEYLKGVISPYSVNNIAVKAGCAALSDIPYFESVKQDILNSKVILRAVFENLSCKVFESKANFLCIDCGEKVDSIYNNLKKNGILVKKFSQGGLLENCLRVTAPPSEKARKIASLLTSKNLIIFDMDGVLIDASSSYRFAVQKTFEYFAGKELPLSKIQDAKNLGGLNNDWDLTEYLLKKEGICIDKNTLIDKFQEFYWNGGAGFISNEKMLLDINLLEKLSGTYNFAIFTGRPRLEAEFALKKNSIEKYFFPIITMDDLPSNRQKPDVLGVELIKKQVLANDIFYLGDTCDDMVCARAADVTAIGVLPPQDKSDSLRNSLLTSGASVVIDEVNRLDSELETFYAKC